MAHDRYNDVLSMQARATPENYGTTEKTHLLEGTKLFSSHVREKTR